jgi:hypothetical protein
MVDSELLRALHNGSLTSQAIGAALGGSFLAREATPTAPHGYTLQFLMAAIKKSDRQRPLQQNK